MCESVPLDADDGWPKRLGIISESSSNENDAEPTITAADDPCTAIE